MPRLVRIPLVLALAGTLAGTLTACDDDGGRTVLTVQAAASLTEPFTTLEKQFEKEHSDVDVRLNFDSSSVLVTQITEGAPADVLATADQATMQTAVDADVTSGDPTLFATNSLVLVLPADNPAGITSFADLDHDDVDFVVCDPSAPCGKSAAAILQADAITRDPASQEINVKGVLAKITAGEADAGIVYVSDAVAAGDQVTTVDIPGADDEQQTYPIVTLQDSAHPGLAQQWVELVTGDAGRQVLERDGFGHP